MTASLEQAPDAQIRRHGLMLVLSSPSGAGKSTIARSILESDDHFALSVSVTTRQRRASEIGGRHYHFIAPDEFARLRADEALLEWAEVHGNLYGTPREPVEQAMLQGRDMLFDIDWQGAQQLQEKARDHIVSVFILPPTIEELRKRLLRRAEDSIDTIEMRLANAQREIEHWCEYDYVVVNHDLDQAFGELRTIVAAERLRRERRPGLADFAGKLLAERLAAPAS